MFRPVLVFLLLASVPAAAQGPAGPSFDCDAARRRPEPLPLLICADPDLSRTDLLFVQAFQALRHQVGEAGARNLRVEAVEFGQRVLARCGIPASGAATPELLRSSRACLLSAYRDQRETWLARLTPLARLEATRPLDTHAALQAALRFFGHLPEAEKVDGVYGPTTRTAIASWQRAQGMPETGFLDASAAGQLARSFVEAYDARGTTPAASAVPAPPASDDAPLDPGRLTREEIRLLQEAFIWAGTYAGLKDGGWGPRSDAALAAWRRGVGLPAGGNPTPREVRLLLAFVGRERERTGWRVWRDPVTGVSVGWPAAWLRHVPQPPGASGNVVGARYEGHPDVLLATIAGNGLDAAGVRAMLEGDAGPLATVTYRLNRPDRQVISYERDGRTHYIRYDLVGGTWRGYVVRVRQGDESLARIIGMIAGDFSADGTPILDALAPLPTFGPILAAARPDAPPPPLAAAPRTPDPVAPVVAPRAPAPPRAARVSGSGTAFRVAPDRAVTNHHVIANCVRITTDGGAPLRVLARDAQRDLALLEAPRGPHLPLAANTTARLGQQVFAFGFPYFQMIGTGLNLTIGNVTAARGIGDATSTFQISAPIQPGNSGGPIVDTTGAVLGVAVSRLNDARVLLETGTVPQAMNYAVRGAVLEGFLLSNGVEATRDPAAVPGDAEAAAARVTPAVFPVLCYGD